MREMIRPYQEGAPRPLTISASVPQPPGVVAGRVSRAINGLMTPWASFRALGGGALFMFSVVALLKGDKPEDWSLQWRLGVLGVGLLWGAVSAKPIYRISAKSITGFVHRCESRRQVRLTIPSEHQQVYALRPAVKVVLGGLMTGAGYGAGLLLVESQRPAIIAAITMAILSVGVAVNCTRSKAKWCVYSGLAGLTVTSVSDFAKIAVERLYDILFDSPMPAGIKWATYFIMTCVVLINGPMFAEKITQNVTAAIAIKNAAKIAPFRQQQLQALISAYARLPNAEENLNAVSSDAAIADLEQRVLATSGDVLINRSAPYEYRLTPWVYLANAMIFAINNYPLYLSGKNTVRNVFSLAGERLLSTYGVAAAIPLFCLQLYLSMTLLEKYITAKRMPQTQVSVGDIAHREVGSSCGWRDVLVSFVAATAPVFFSINARRGAEGGVVATAMTIGLVACTLYASLLTLLAPMILPKLCAEPPRSPAEQYVDSLLACYQQREQAAEKIQRTNPHGRPIKPAKIEAFLEPLGQGVTAAAATRQLVDQLKAAIQALDDYLDPPSQAAVVRVAPAPSLV